MAKPQKLSPRELVKQFSHLEQQRYTHVKLPEHSVLPSRLRGACIRIYQAQVILELALKMKMIADDVFAQAWALENGYQITVYPHHMLFEELTAFLPKLSSNLAFKDALDLDTEAEELLFVLSSAIIQKPNWAP